MQSRSLARDLRTVPNLITLARIFIVAGAAWAFLTGFIWLAILLGAAAGVSDHLDGIFARRLNQVTDLGEVLDQFSDLIMEAVFLLLLITHERGPAPYVLAIYLFREFWVVTIRRYMASKGLNIKSSFLGKVKSNVIGWSLIFYCIYVANLLPDLELVCFWIGAGGLWAGLGISWYTGLDYTRQFVRGYNSIPG